MRMGRWRGRERRRTRKATKTGGGVGRVEEREEWDDEVKRSNEEVTCRVEDQEREEEMRIIGREEGERTKEYGL